MNTRKADGALSIRDYVGYALGDTASNLFFQTFAVFLTYYYVDVWGIGAAAVATMMLVVRFFDAVVDPVIGLLADRTKSRWGRFRPYILWGAVPYGVFGYLLFANPSLSENGKLWYAYLTYTGMLLAYSAINVPYSALLGVLSPSSAIRGAAASYRFVGAYMGGLLINLGAKPLVHALGEGNEVAGFQRTMAGFAVLSVALFWLCFAWTRERVQPPAGQKSKISEDLLDLVRNRPWVVLLVASVFSTTFIMMRGGSTLFYFKYYLGDDGTPILFGTLDRATVFLATGMSAQIVGTFGLSFIVKAVDKRVLATVLSILTSLAFASSFVLPKENYGLLLAVNAFGTFCMGPTSALVWALYADVADYGEWKFGRRSTGLVYSASLFALKTGQTLAGFLVPIFLAKFGFVKGVAQTQDAMLGILLAFSLMPGIFAALKAAAIWWVPLSRAEVAQIEGELRSRRAAAAAPEAEPRQQTTSGQFPLGAGQPTRS
jgi:glycoside/pentoside/hexuronide:cation symporter, GPH family